MPRLVIAFLRHGDYFQRADTPSALQPYELNATGLEQATQGAMALAKFAQHESLALHPVIDSSSLLRAWQTASVIKDFFTTGDEKALSVASYDALCERSVGSVANLTIAEIEALIIADPRLDVPAPHWKSNSHYCLPFQGAESLLDAGQRVAEHIQQCVQQLQTQITQDTLKVLVGHGASFRHAAYCLKILEFAQIKQLSMYHARPLLFEFFADQSSQHIAGDWKIRGKKSVYSD